MGQVKLGFFIFLVVVAGLIMFFNLATLGLPGSCLFAVGDQLPTLVLGRLSSDSYESIDFFIGFLWPPFVPVAYWLSRRITFPQWASLIDRIRPLFFVVLTYVWLVFLSLALRLSAPW
jgi:hypothetical protein